MSITTSWRSKKGLRILATQMNDVEMFPRSVATHDGPFHADEVTACALLILYDRIERNRIIRTRDPQQIASCEYVCDVGAIYDPERKLFDHHQIDYQGPLSSAGMVWQYFLDEGIVAQEEFDYLNELLVWGVDAHDNGQVVAPKGVCTFSHIISQFSPITYDAPLEAFESGFQTALDFTLGHLRRVQEHREHARAYRTQVQAAMDGARECLVFQQRLPWIDNFFALGGVDHPALFVIMPTGGGWKLRGIPPSPDDRMGVRMKQPKEWAGLMNQELVMASGIKGAVFCHKGRFISVWETKAAAEAALVHILRSHHDDGL